MNIQHSSRTDDWGTPLSVLVRVHRVLGPIDLDPASAPHWNARVGAKYFFTKEQDGLETPWPENCRTVFINPPGGKHRNRSLTELFWQRLMAHRDAQHLDHAIFLAFSLEAVQTTQRDGRGGILAWPCCVPAKRIAFESSPGVVGAAPSHSNIICYLPGSVDRSTLFRQTFKGFGVCT